MLIETLQSEIEHSLNQLVPEQECPYSDLFTAARYTLLAQAKRIRPILTLLTIHMLGKDYKIGIEPACALEMIHTYSLIHDDLPSMDNDLLRRGKPTLHHVYTEGHAILTGDFLLTVAFETIAKASHISDKQRVDLIRIAANSSGADGMIGGQIIDLFSTEKKKDIEELYSKKTAALFQAAFAFGGIIASAQEHVLECLKKLGLNFGILFQAADDIHDKQHEKQAYQVGSLSYRRLLDELGRLPYDISSIRTLIDRIWKAV